MSARSSGRSRWLRGSGLALALCLLSCNASKDMDPSDPLGDPFFADGFGGSSLDEVLNKPAPSVGWLSNEDLYDRERAQPGEGEDDMLRRERSVAGAGEVVEAERRNDLRERGEPIDGAGDEDGESGSSGSISRRQKSFSEQAQEATLATMSVLIGAGMAALPYLLGT